MNVLVTGGIGFIGSNYCVNSISRFNKLIIIDRKIYCNTTKNIGEIIHYDNLVYIEGDLLELDLFEIYNKYSINYIIHFAAQTHVDNSYNMINAFINDNINVTCKLLESCKEYNKLIRIILMSTDEIYGPSITEELFETSNFNPTNQYSASKASAEMFINAYKYSYNLPIIIIRCNNVYGL